MIPYLVQQGGLVRGWGSKAISMTNVAMTYPQLVTPNPNRQAIDVPPTTQVVTIAFQDEMAADNRIGNEVFDSLPVPRVQKRYVTVNSDIYGQPAFDAEHGAPGAAATASAWTPSISRYGAIMTCSTRARSPTAIATPTTPSSAGGPTAPTSCTRPWCKSTPRTSGPTPQCSPSATPSRAPRSTRTASSGARRRMSAGVM